MDNPRFIDDEAIPLVEDEDYVDYITPNTNRVDETSLTEPDTTEATQTLRLRQKVKLNKLTALIKHLNVTVDPDLADIDRFMIKKIQRPETLTCFFSMAMNIGNPLPINILVSFYRQGQ